VIAELVERLRQAEIRFAVIGAAAMAARGFPRQTLDFDLLTTDTAVLAAKLWSDVPAAAVRRGDFDDPLAGVVRLVEPRVDIVVGRERWKGDVVARSTEMHLGDLILPVAALPDLIALKLDAGGYRDRTDVLMMLSGASSHDLAAVEALLSRLPAEARELWNEIRLEWERSSR
jgi:hypothetical protein